jgi:hypothetical protein
MAPPPHPGRHAASIGDPRAAAGRGRTGWGNGEEENEAKRAGGWRRGDIAAAHARGGEGGDGGGGARCGEVALAGGGWSWGVGVVASAGGMERMEAKGWVRRHGCVRACAAACSRWFFLPRGVLRGFEAKTTGDLASLPPRGGRARNLEDGRVGGRGEGWLVGSVGAVGWVRRCGKRGSGSGRSRWGIVFLTARSRDRDGDRRGG